MMPSHDSSLIILEDVEEDDERKPFKIKINIQTEDEEKKTRDRKMRQEGTRIMLYHDDDVMLISYPDD